jgi:hypothetical protein
MQVHSFTAPPTLPSEGLPWNTHVYGSVILKQGAQVAYTVDAVGSQSSNDVSHLSALCSHGCTTDYYNYIIGSPGTVKYSDKCPLCVISGFRREQAENCALLGHYAASSGNFLFTQQVVVISY